VANVIATEHWRKPTQVSCANAAATWCMLLQRTPELYMQQKVSVLKQKPVQRGAEVVVV